MKVGHCRWAVVPATFLFATGRLRSRLDIGRRRYGQLSITHIFPGNDEVIAAKWRAVPEGPWNLAGGESHRNPSPPRFAPAGAAEHSVTQSGAEGATFYVARRGGAGGKCGALRARSQVSNVINGSDSEHISSFAPIRVRSRFLMHLGMLSPLGGVLSSQSLSTKALGALLR